MYMCDRGLYVLVVIESDGNRVMDYFIWFGCIELWKVDMVIELWKVNMVIYY